MTLNKRIAILVLPLFLSGCYILQGECDGGLEIVCNWGKCECVGDDEATVLDDLDSGLRCETKFVGACLLSKAADDLPANSWISTVLNTGDMTPFSADDMTYVTDDGHCGEGWKAEWPCAIDADPVLVIDPLAGVGVDMNAFEYTCGACPEMTNAEWLDIGALAGDFAWCQFTHKAFGYPTGYIRAWENGYYSTPLCGVTEGIEPVQYTNTEGVATRTMTGGGIGLCDDDSDCDYLSGIDNDLNYMEGTCEMWPVFRHYDSYQHAWIDEPRGCFRNDSSNGGVVPTIPGVAGMAIDDTSLLCNDFTCEVSGALLDTLLAHPIDATAGMDWQYDATSDSLLIRRVEDYSIGALAGVEPLDVVVSVGNEYRSISDPMALLAAMREYHDEGTSIEIVRDSTVLVLNVVEI